MSRRFQRLRLKKVALLIATAGRPQPAERFLLSDELEHRPVGDPERTFVAYMCLYARDLATGDLPGPYTEQRARRFARACLIPAELAERPGLDTTRVAAALGVPEHELHAARRVPPR